MRRSLLSVLLREPIVGFTIAGVAIFAFHEIVAPAETPRIEVTRDTIRALVETREEIVGRSLLEGERESLIHEYVDREILVREALARGLHERDGRVRGRLVDKMLFLIDEEPPEPDPEDLVALHASDPHAYRVPAAITFEHVFFAGDAPPPASLAPALRSGTSPTEVQGDDFWLGSRIVNVSSAEISAVLGREFAEALGECAEGTWLDPLRSSRGWHIVRIVERRAPEPLPPEILQRALREDWLSLRRSEARERRLAELRAGYVVEVSDAGAASG